MVVCVWGGVCVIVGFSQSSFEGTHPATDDVIGTSDQAGPHLRLALGRKLSQDVPGKFFWGERHDRVGQGGFTSSVFVV